MKSLCRIALFVCLLTGLYASAQTGPLSGRTFPLDPTTCSADAALECVIDVGLPQPPLYEFSWGEFYPTYIIWENNPMAPLGDSDIVSQTCTATKTFTSGAESITACAVMVLEIHGEYRGGGSYTGVVTVNLTYTWQVSRYSQRWSRKITSGTVAIQ